MSQQSSSASLLHHIALGARDVEALGAFYREAFSLLEITRHLDAKGELRSIWLSLGGAILMIERTHDTARHVDGVGAGPFLLAFSVSQLAHAAREDALAQMGAPTVDRTAMTTYHRDPEGNRIALSHYPLPQGGARH